MKQTDGLKGLGLAPRKSPGGSAGRAVFVPVVGVTVTASEHSSLAMHMVAVFTVTYPDESLNVTYIIRVLSPEVMEAPGGTDQKYR